MSWTDRGGTRTPWFVNSQVAKASCSASRKPKDLCELFLADAGFRAMRLPGRHHALGERSHRRRAPTRCSPTGARLRHTCKQTLLKKHSTALHWFSSALAGGSQKRLFHCAKIVVRARGHLHV